MVQTPTGPKFLSSDVATIGQISDRSEVFELGRGHQWSSFRPVPGFELGGAHQWSNFRPVRGFEIGYATSTR
jgi:hypothetical protein